MCSWTLGTAWWWLILSALLDSHSQIYRAKDFQGQRVFLSINVYLLWYITRYWQKIRPRLSPQPKNRTVLWWPLSILCIYDRHIIAGLYSLVWGKWCSTAVKNFLFLSPLLYSYHNYDPNSNVDRDSRCLRNGI